MPDTQILQDLDRLRAGLNQLARVSHEITMVGGDFTHHWHLYVTGSPGIGESGDGTTLEEAYSNLLKNLKASPQ